MASTNYARPVLNLVLILLVLQCYGTNSHQGNIGMKRKLLRAKTRTKLFQQINVLNDVAPANANGRKLLKDASEISGENEPAPLKKSFEEPQKDVNCVNSKNKGKMSKQKGKEGNHKSKYDQKIDDSAARLEARANEVANLMGKDYKGARGPRRKPPINNHEPTD